MAFWSAAFALGTTLCTTLFELTLLGSRYVANDLFQMRVLMAALGRFTITHGMLVMPLLLLGLLLLAPLLRGRGEVRQTPAWIAASALIATLVVGCGVLSQRALSLGPLTLTPLLAALGGVLLAIALYLFFARVAGPGFRGVVRQVAMGLAALFVVMLLAAPFLTRGTPLSGPVAYQLEAPESALPAANRDGRAPNVVLIVLDTLRADHLRAYGYDRDTAPFLDELFQKSVVFDRAVSPGIETLPSHASIFTGLTIREHGIKGNGGFLDDGFDTLAEVAVESGYQTVAFSSNINVDDSFNATQGFDWLYPIWSAGWLSRSFSHHWLSSFGIAASAGWLERDLGAGMVSYMTQSWIEKEYDSRDPAFIFYNYMEAHTPHRPPFRYREMFLGPEDLKRSYELDRDYADILEGPELDMPFALNPSLVPPRDIEIYKGLYDASIRYMDDRLRELFDHLEANGLLEDAVVIVTSDHGEGLGDHGLFNHHSSVNDMLVHVPLALHRTSEPGSGSRVAAEVSTRAIFDVGKAIVSADDSPSTEAMVGLLVQQAEQNPVISECLVVPSYVKRAEQALGGKENEGFQRTFRALSHGSMKFIQASDGSAELYDILKDPGELADLAVERPEMTAEFTALLLAWLEMTPDFEGNPDDQPVLSPEQLEILKGLGYISD